MAGTHDPRGIIATYLNTLPYRGRTSRADNQYIKDVITGTGGFDANFEYGNGQRGMWYTTSINILTVLVRSGKFFPFGIEEQWMGAFQEAAETMRADMEHNYLQKEAQREREQKEEAARRSKAKPAPTPIAKPTKKLDARLAFFKPKQTTKSAPKAAPAVAPRATQTQAPTSARKSAGASGVSPSSTEVALCGPKGSVVALSKEVIAYSDGVTWLGPRGTLSDEGRILRWCKVIESDARETLLHGPLGDHDWFYGLEPDPKAYGRDAYFDEERCASLAALGYAKFADELVEQWTQNRMQARVS